MALEAAWLTEQQDQYIAHLRRRGHVPGAAPSHQPRGQHPALGPLGPLSPSPTSLVDAKAAVTVALDSVCPDVRDQLGACYCLPFERVLLTSSLTLPWIVRIVGDVRAINAIWPDWDEYDDDGEEEDK